jgi:hypothetical protein
MSFFRNKRNCLFKIERVTMNSRSSFHLRRERMENLIKNLHKARILLVVLRAQLVLFKINMMSYKRIIKILKCNLMLFGQSLQSSQVIPKPLKLLQAMVVKML